MRCFASGFGNRVNGNTSCGGLQPDARCRPTAARGEWQLSGVRNLHRLAAFPRPAGLIVALRLRVPHNRQFPSGRVDMKDRVNIALFQAQCFPPLPE